MTVESAVGMVAFITTFIGLLPQVYKVMITKSTHDISLLMLLNYFICSLAWIIYGAYIHSNFVISSNVVGLITSIILLAQKYYYERYRI